VDSSETGCNHVNSEASAAEGMLRAARGFLGLWYTRQSALSWSMKLVGDLDALDARQLGGGAFPSTAIGPAARSRAMPSVPVPCGRAGRRSRGGGVPFRVSDLDLGGWCFSGGGKRPGDSAGYQLVLGRTCLGSGDHRDTRRSF
jgi:hypothetical protein